MFRSFKDLRGYRIHATDGNLGKVDDLLFDDLSWVIRYLVADTGHWLPGRLVLLSPVSLQEPDFSSSALPVSLTSKQIEHSPSLSEHQPVSRRHERELVEYYEWPAYWADAFIPSFAGPAATEAAAIERMRSEQRKVPEEDVHLRSAREVRGYYIQADDGEIGHVDDFIVDTAAWRIRYAVIDTRNWWPGERVLIAPRWIDRIEWAQRKVFIEMTREMIRSCPPYDPSAPVNRQYEERLYDYYGRPKYWE